MAYTVAFDNTYPPGNTAASLISQTFRNKTTMVGERLQDIFGMPDYTSDPLKINFVRVGYGISTFGGYVKFTDDTGTYRWFSGIGNGAAAKNFVIFDVVNNAGRLIIDNATGDVTIANGLTINQGLTVTTNLAVGGTLTVTGITNTSNLAMGANAITATNYQILGNGAATFASVTSNGTVAATGAITSAGGTCTFAGLNVTGNITSANSISAPAGIFGTNPASVGSVRIQNNTSVVSRNVANTGDIVMMFVDNLNQINIGGAGNGAVFNGGVTMSTLSCSTITASGNISVPHANSVSAGSFFVI